VLWGLALVAMASAAAFMTFGAHGDWDFVLAFRGRKLIAMCLVGVATALSAVMFQTVTRNRILSPAIMGFDSLYISIQTGLVLLLGSRRLAGTDPQLRFVLETLVMVGLAVLLFRWLITRRGHDIYLLVLAGIVCGVLFRSLSSMGQRILDPNEFSVLQDLLFANFSRVETGLLPVAGVVVLLCCVAAARLSPTLDVLTLGRETAIGLGINYRRIVTAVLFLVAVLVSVSTALVGPVTFFGLLVANLAYAVTGSTFHRDTLPAAALLAVIVLLAGQTLLEHLFGLNAALSVIIEFAGGVAFLFLLLRGAVR
jgi:iron complex transport system permease protein